jgi:putative DNA primase/helicase
MMSASTLTFIPSTDEDPSPPENRITPTGRGEGDAEALEGAASILTEGAAASSHFYAGTDKLVYDDILKDVVERYLREIDPTITGEPAPHPSQIKHDILMRTNSRLEIVNDGLKGHDRLTRLKVLTSSQIARILMALHHVVTISPNGLGSSKDYDLIGVYVEDGINAGTYVTSETQIGAIARRYNGELTVNGTKEIMLILRQEAPQKVRTLDRDLIPGVFDYKSKTLLPFSSDMIFLGKARVDLNETAVSPRTTNPDGTEWEVEEWIASLSDDPEIVDLRWQIIGAHLRPFVRWNKTAWLYSEEGRNGKGTFCGLMRNVVGEASAVVLPLASFSTDFMLEPLQNATAIIVDENDVGVYLDKVANLKAVVTNDILMINRKGKIPVSFRFWGFMTQCLNEFPQVRDRSESFYRRQLFVPFEKNFTNDENTSIKDDYLNRPEVLEYVLKRALIDTPEYYKLDEPAATKAVLAQYKEANDPIRQFWNEYEEHFAWDLLPNQFLFDAYKMWFSKNVPSGKIVGRNTFINEIHRLAVASGGWISRKTSPARTGNKMSQPERLIVALDIKEWMKAGYGGKDINELCRPVPSKTYKGLERLVPRTVAVTVSDDDDLESDA